MHYAKGLCKLYMLPDKEPLWLHQHVNETYRNPGVTRGGYCRLDKELCERTYIRSHDETWMFGRLTTGKYEYRLYCTVDGAWTLDLLEGQAVVKGLRSPLELVIERGQLQHILSIINFICFSHGKTCFHFFSEYIIRTLLSGINCNPTFPSNSSILVSSMDLAT